MTIQFKETMTGEATLDGRQRALALELEAKGDSVFALGGWGPLELEGTVKLESVTDEAEVLEGSMLHIGLPFHRTVDYQVYFRDTGGAVYRFIGGSTVDLLDLPRSLMTVTGPLFRDGREIGRAALTVSFKGWHRLAEMFGSIRRERDPSPSDSVVESD